MAWERSRVALGLTRQDRARSALRRYPCTWVASPDKVSEVDRLVESHGSFMAKTHDRDGSNALLSYDLSKGPELENPLDPSRRPREKCRTTARRAVINWASRCQRSRNGPTCEWPTRIFMHRRSRGECPLLPR
jgi:hypothetical protein